MSDMNNQTSPPGWHPDPKDPTRLRFWDGTQWTEHTSEATSAATKAKEQLAVVTPDQSDVSMPQRTAVEPAVFGSVRGWKPVRRLRVDDRTALRKGALVGVALGAVAWVLLAGVAPIDSFYDTAPYFSLVRIYPDTPAAQPVLSAALVLVAIVTGWLVARAATNSRAGLSVGAAAGAVFMSSLVISLLGFAAWWVFSRYDDFGFSDAVRNVVRILFWAGFYALCAVPMGVIGWLIGRPKPLWVDATATLDQVQQSASDELMLLLSGLRNQKVDRPALSTLSVSLRFYPGWSVLLGVLLFPLGVLAVLAGQREEIGTIIVNDAGDGSSTFQARGLFDEAACTRIEAFLIDSASDI